jgi:UDP-N-acetyl-D-glucosamine dehydrogenase
VAYKKNVDDTRESPALTLIELLEARGAECAFHDPFIPKIPVTREHAPLAGRRSIELTGEAVAGCDAVLVATDNDGVDYALVAANAPLIIDTRNVFARLGLSNSAVVKA